MNENKKPSTEGEGRWVIKMKGALRWATCNGQIKRPPQVSVKVIFLETAVTPQNITEYLLFLIYEGKSQDLIGK